MTKKVIKISVSLCLLGLLFWVYDISSVWQHVKKVEVLTIAGCIIALFLAQAMSSLRWQWILKDEGAKIPLKTLFASYMIGMFVNNFMPTSIGGDTVKIYDVYRLTKDSSLSISSVFFERFTGLMVLILLSWIGANYYLSDFPASFLWGWIFINIACVFVIVCLTYKGLGEWILRRTVFIRLEKITRTMWLVYKRLIAFKNKKALLAKLLIISIPIQLVTIILYQQVAFALGVRLPFFFFIGTIPLITLISLIPVSLGGLGVREAMTVITFSRAGVQSDVALSVSLIYLSITYMVSLIGAILLILRDSKIAGTTEVKNEILKNGIVNTEAKGQFDQ